MASLMYWSAVPVARLSSFSAVSSSWTSADVGSGSTGSDAIDTIDISDPIGPTVDGDGAKWSSGPTISKLVDVLQFEHRGYVNL